MLNDGWRIQHSVIDGSRWKGSKETEDSNFPGGLAVKNPPANAGDMDSIRGPERSTCCRATKPVCHNCWAQAPWRLCSITRGASQGVCALQRERSLHSSKPRTAQINNIIFKKDAEDLNSTINQLILIAIYWTLHWKSEHTFFFLIAQEKFKIWLQSENHSVVSDCLWPHGRYSPWNSLGQNTGVGSLSLLQWIFLTQE